MPFLVRWLVFVASSFMFGNRKTLKTWTKRPMIEPAPEAVDSDAIIAKGHALCRRIVLRDLGDSPLYIVRQSAIATELGAGKGCSGYTTPSLDLYQADRISDYQGRGPCNLRNQAAELERTITTHRQRAADLRTRANHHESQIPALERQLGSLSGQIAVNERTEAALRDRLLVP